MAAAILVHDKHHQHNVHIYHYTYYSYWVLWRRRQRQCFRPGSFVQLSGRNILDTPALVLSMSDVKFIIATTFTHLHFWQSIAHVADDMTILVGVIWIFYVRYCDPRIANKSLGRHYNECKSKIRLIYQENVRISLSMNTSGIALQIMQIWV